VTAAPDLPLPPPLAHVAAVLRAEGGLLAEVVSDAPVATPDDALARLAGSGPRAAARGDDVAFCVEAVREGYLLHHGPTRPSARIVSTEDDDLGLLAGDRLYALGLAGLADQGDLVAIAELADIIALCAQAHAAGDPALATAVWQAGCAAVGWGSSPDHEAAKEAARAGDPSAASALHAAARRAAGEMACPEGPVDRGASTL
jgi:hypothetical protein